MKLLGKVSLLFLFAILISCSPQERSAETKLNKIIEDLSFDAIYPDAKEFKDQADLRTLENSAFKPEFYDLKMQILPQSKIFHAVLKIKIEKLRESKTLTLNAGSQIEFKSVKAENIELPMVNRTNIDVEFDSSSILKNTFWLEIEYSLKGQNDGINYVQNNKGEVVQVWSRHQPNYARLWFPSFDWPGFKTPKKFSISAPADWSVLSNGSLEHIKNSTHTWVDLTPQATYLYSFIAGPMDVFTLDKNNFYSLWLPKGFSANAEQTLLEMKKSVQTFAQLLVPYPYEKLALGIAYDFAGAMEHSNAVTFSHMNHHPQSGFDVSILAHEIAHQWFGDLVTCKTWDDLWLNEGFATYFETLYADQGKDDFSYRMEGHRKRYLQLEARKKAEGGTGPIYDPQTSATQKFNVLSYEKPAVVAHMLREQLGDELFFDALKFYLNKFKYKTATSTEFANAIQEFTKKDLKWFFDQWIFTKGHAKVEYSWKWENNQLTIKYQQLRDDIVYQLPTEVWMTFGSTSRLEKIILNQKEGEVLVTNIEQPLAVVLDPEHKVLAEFESKKSVAEWKEIFSSAHFISQIEAFKNIAKSFSKKEVIDALKTKNNYVKAEILNQIIKLDFTKEELINIATINLQSPTSTLRISAAVLAGELKAPEVEDILIQTYLNDPSLYAAAMAGESLVKMKSQKAVSVFNTEINRFPKRHWKILMAAVSGLAEMNVISAGDRLIEIFNGELNAARFYKISVAAALAKLKDKRATKPIGEELIKEQNPDIGLGYVRALELMSDKEAAPYLREISQDPQRTKKLRAAAYEVFIKLK